MYCTPSTSEGLPPYPLDDRRPCAPPFRDRPVRSYHLVARDLSSPDRSSAASTHRSSLPLDSADLHPARRSCAHPHLGRALQLLAGAPRLLGSGPPWPRS